MALLSIEDAAQELKFPGGRNKLFAFLRKHAGFQGKIAPYSLVFNGFFKVIDHEFEQGRKKIYTQTTKVTTEGLSYIAQLMADHLEQEGIKK